MIWGRICRNFDSFEEICFAIIFKIDGRKLLTDILDINFGMDDIFF